MPTLFLNILKFLVFLLSIPVIMAVSYAFNGEMVVLKLFHHKAFLIGISVYVFFYFFIYKFEPLYEYGRALIGQIFRMFGASIEKGVYLVPIYTLLLLVFYYIFTSMGRMNLKYGVITSFGIAFTFSMHIIMTANELYQKDEALFKPTYCIGISLVYILNVILMAGLFDVVFPGFSFIDFLAGSIDKAEHIYRLVWTQLF